MGTSKLMMGTIAAAVGVGMLIGGLIGYLSAPKPAEESTEVIDWSAQDWINERIVQLVDRDRIKNSLRNITIQPHLATTPRDNELAVMIRQAFDEAGFDDSSLVAQDFYISLPDPENPNKIKWLNSTGHEVFVSKHMEEALHEDDADDNFVHAFNAYSPAMDVETALGQGLVYVNYGREEDFEKLETLGVDVRGNIVVARYGKIFRGNKVEQAQKRGAKGVILFSDPEDVAPVGTASKDVYPNSWWLPGSGMQRGSIFLGDGDPLTPGWPSTDTAHRIDESAAGLPTIPSQPIGYNDARIILEKMGGTPPPEEWVGGIEGVDYSLGPTFKPEFSDYKLTMSTHNQGSVKKSYNVIGIIKGSVEPDRYVLVGNHRDAWGYGASDPSSGTAQLLETARVFGELMSEGWKPRRTIVFCSWGAEEHGLIGSTEWVEQHVSKLQQRSVMYLNTDTCTKGPILKVAGSPLVWGAANTLTKLMPGVDDEEKTLYEEWADYHSHYERPKPKVDLIGSGSDHAPFAFYAGISAMDMDFDFDTRIYNISFYPYYHTGYETFYMVEKHIDPSFAITQGCSRLAALTLRYFADSLLLPYSLSDLPKAMSDSYEAINDKHGEKLTAIYPDFGLLGVALDNMARQVETFINKLEELTIVNLDAINLRAINDQLIAIERLFLIPGGLPDRPLARHAIFAPSQFDNYSGQGFPGIVDLLYKIDDLTGDERAAREEAIRRHISQLIIIVQRVSSHLKDLHLI